MKNRITAQAAFIAALIATASYAQAQEVSFTDSDGVLPVDEGSAIDAPFSVSPTLTQATTVFYDVDYDTADADDHSRLSGEVELPAGATAGTIRVSITDDADIELPRETFDLRFTVPGGSFYTVGTTGSVTVNIREGICDRSNEAVRAIWVVTGLGGTQDSCNDFTSEDLAGTSNWLGMDGQGATSLKAGDFSGLTAVPVLQLFDNHFQQLPAGVFSGLDRLRGLRLEDNLFDALSPGMFLGLSMLNALHLHNNPGAPFELALRLESADETALSEALPTFDPAPVRLTLAEGAPYPLAVDLELTNLSVSDNPVMVPAGSTQSETFTVTRDGGTDSFTIDFAELPPPPNDCNHFPRHAGQCFAGFEIVPPPRIVYAQDGTGPQVSTIRFTSVPQSPDTYGTEAGETIDVDVVFDRGLIVPSFPVGSSSPRLALQIGDNRRTATYAPSRSDGVVLSFSYTLVDYDFDEDGVSVASGGLELGDGPITDVFGRTADATLESHLLAARPGHKVAARMPLVTFTDENRFISLREGEMVVAELDLSPPPQGTLGVHYTVTEETAAAGDYDAGGGMVTVPAGETTGGILISITDDEDIDLPREVFYLDLIPSGGYILGDRPRLKIEIHEGVCDRTPQVRDLIRDRPCHEMRSVHLESITSLSLSGGKLGDVEILKSKDLSGLNRLVQLFLQDNQLTELPQGLFDGFPSGFERLNISGNRLERLPPGIFSGLSGLQTVHLFDNPGAPFRLVLRLESAGETALSSALLTFDPAPVRLTVAEGAPYPLEVHFEVSGVTLSASPVTISTGETRSEEFTMTRTSESFSIGFAEPSPPNNCQSGHRHEGQCYTGIKVAGLPIVYAPGGTGPQVSTIRFTSVPQSLNTYSAELGETIDVDVVFNRGLVVTSDGVTSPTLLLQIGANQRAATYVPHLSGDDVLRFSYTLMEDDLDEDGVSVVGLQTNGATITGVFRPANLALESRFLNDRPGHKVVARVPTLTFTDSNRFIQEIEGRTINAELALSSPPQNTLVVHYTVTEDSADADDYDAGNGTVEVPAGSMTGAIRIPIIDDEDIELPREVFYLDLDLSVGYILGDRPRLKLQINEGVCDRTLQVSNRIQSVRSKSSCVAIDSGDLSNLTILSLSGGRLGDVEILKSKDLSGLSRLQQLFLQNNRLTGLPQGLFDDLSSRLFRLQIDGNRLKTLPPGIFSGLSGLQTVHLFGNPGAPFRLVLRLESVGETALSSALLTFNPAPVRLTVAEGAPYPLEVHFEVSGATLSASPVTISTGETRSEEFTVTRTSESFSIDFAEPSPPNNCRSGDRHEGQCYTGIEVAGLPIVYAPDGTGPQVSTIQFTSVPFNPNTYNPKAGEMIDVDVIFNRELIITPTGVTSPTLVLQIGDQTHAATYVSDRSGGDVLSFSYTFMEGDLDEDGVSVADESSLQLNDAGLTDIFGRAAEVTLAARFLADRPGHKVMDRAILVTFTDSDGRIGSREGQTANAAFALSSPLQKVLTVHYTAENGTADAGDYDAGSGSVEVPAGKSQGNIQISIIDDDDIDLPNETFYINLDLSADYTLGDRPRLNVEIHEGVCDRTPQVRDRIRDRPCHEMRSNHLESITVLSLSGGKLGNVEILKSKDLSGLSGLQQLFMQNNQLTGLPQGLFDDLSSSLFRLQIDGNRLKTLPTGIFSGLSGLQTVHLFGNPGAPFRLILRLESAGETALSEALLTFDPAPVRLTLAEGAPYPLEVHFEVSGATLSASSVTISTGETRSEEFTVTRTGESFSIGFAELPPAPNNCRSGDRHEGQCYPGIEIAGSPIVYAPGETGPQVSTIQFTSVPRGLNTYSAESGETIDVDVVFDNGLVVTSDEATSPTLALQIGANQRTATYVPYLSGGDVLSFSYTLMEGDLDEDGVGVAPGGLQLNGSTVTDVFDRPADVMLAPRFLNDRPGHKVAASLVFLTFTDADGFIALREGETVVAEFSLSPAPQNPLVVRYDVTEDSADADDYDAGSGMVTVPAGETTGAILIPVTDDEDIETFREIFHLHLVLSESYALGDRPRLNLQINEGICDRTPALRDFMVRVHSGWSHCAEFTSLNAYDVLQRERTGPITSLKEKDFLQFNRLHTLDLRNNQLMDLPPGLFSGLRNLRNLRLNDNQLAALPPGIFSGLSGLQTVHLFGNPGAPFRLVVRLESAGETALSEALLTFAPVPVRLTVAEGAPYPLAVDFELTNLSVSTSPVMIAAGATRSEEFTVTRAGGTNSFRIGFAELPPAPNNCQSGHRHEGQCYTGIEVAGSPIVYAPGETEPQVSTIRFTSAPQNPPTYSAESGETIGVDVVFDSGVIVTSSPTLYGVTSPTLALRIGSEERIATYAFGRSGGNVLHFNYTLTADDLDEDGVSVAGLQMNDATIAGVFGPANLALEPRFLNDRPGHKVAARIISLSFTDSDGEIREPEEKEDGRPVVISAEFALSSSLQEMLVVHYTVTENSADADDYDAGDGMVTVPAGETTATILISIISDDDIEPPRERFDIDLVPAFGYKLEGRSKLSIFIHEGVCDRTPEVSDRIQSVRSKSSCEAVHSGDLNGLATLSLSGGRLGDVTTLKSKDFSGLGGLIQLFLQNNRLTELPQGLFDGFPSDFERLRIDGNRLERLPPGIFSGLTGLLTVHLFDNPGAPFRSAVRFEPAGETALSEALLSFDPAPVRLTVAEGAPYPLEVHFEVSGVTLSDNPVTIPTGATRSEEFTVTRISESFSIGFAEPPPAPNNCQSGHRHEGQCYTGIEVAGSPIVHAPGRTGPQVSEIRFTSAPQNPPAYSAESGETIDVDVVFDSGVIVTSSPTLYGVTSPTLALRIGSEERIAAYAFGRSGGNVLRFSYTLTADDFDEDGVSVAGLQMNDATIAGVFGPANLALEPRFLNDRPGHKVAARIISLWFTDSNGEIFSREGETAVADFALGATLRETLVVHYTFTEGSADADDYDDVGNGMLEVPAGSIDDAILIPIIDDDDAEQARDRFGIELAPGFGYKPISGSGKRTKLTVVIQEGVCDRTPPIRDRLRGGSHCSAPNSGALRNFSGNLGFSGQLGDVTTLKSKDFSGLTRLRELFLSSNQLTELPQGLFDDLSGRFFRLHIIANHLTALPPGIFSGLSGLRTVLLHGNPGAPFRLVVRLESVGETELSSALLTFAPAPVRLTLAEGAPYPLEVHFDEVSGVMLSASSVAISTGATQSGEFTVTRLSESFSIGFAEPPAPPKDCDMEDQYEGLCYTGIEIVGSPVSYAPGRTGPQVSEVRFTSAPQSPLTYSVALGETIDVDVIFDSGVIVTSSPTLHGVTSPTLALQIGDNRRTATYVPHRSGGDVLSFSYALMEDDLDEDGVSVAGLQLNGASIAGVFGPADLALEPRFLDARPGHKVAARTFSVSFTRSSIFVGEGGTAEAIFEITPAPAEPNTVFYVIDYATADADDHDTVPDRLEIVVPAGQMRGTIRIRIIDDDDIESLREWFNIDLVLPLGYSTERRRITVSILEGVCDRTPAIRNYLVEASPSSPGCRDFNSLSFLSSFLAGNRGITSLKEKDFYELSSLETLELHGNQLTALPPGLFSGLPILQDLRLDGNNVTALPATIFSGLRSLRKLRLNDNRLAALPPGIFTGLSSLEALHLHGNAVTFATTLRLALDHETQDLSSVFSPLVPAPFRLTLLEGAPYPLQVRLAPSGVTLSTNAVVIPAGATRSETFTVTWLRGVDTIGISFAQLPSPPNDCEDDDKHQGQCFTGFEFAGEPFSYTQSGPGPQVSTIRFTSVPPGLQTYSAALRETIDVNVIFDGELIVPSFSVGSSSPTLALQIGDNRRTATYVPSRSGGNVLSFSYTLMENDLDEDGVSVATGGLDLGDGPITDVFGRNANATLENRFLNDRPGHKVAATVVFLTFAEQDRVIPLREDAMVFAAELDLNAALREPLVVHYTVTADSADADDYRDDGNGMVTLPAGSTTGAIRISIIDDEDIEPLREVFHLDLVPSDDYALGDRPRLRVIILEGTCDRTKALRDFLIQVESGGEIVESGEECAQFSHLDHYGRLQLGRTDLTSLKEKDFSGFSQLHTLLLNGNQLTALPSGLFNGLGNLRELRLQRNNLTALPSGLFNGLGNLEVLLLQHQYPDESSRGLTALPERIFSGLDSLQMLRLDANRLTALPPGVFSGLSGLNALHLHDNPGSMFALTLRLESAGETALSETLQTFNPATVRLTLLEGAPYDLDVQFEASGVTLPPSPVMISAGATQSETFTVTRNRGAARIEIHFAELPPPNDCNDNRKYNGQCFTGFEVAGSPIVYEQGGAGPQVSAIRFTSVPRSLYTYSAALREAIDVNVIFDRGLIVSSSSPGGGLPTLALRVGNSMRTATYVPSRSGGNVLGFSYTLMEGDLDEDGVSVARDGLQLNGATATDIFGRPADVSLANRFLNDLPEHRVAAIVVLLEFSGSGENIFLRESETGEAIFEITPAQAEPITVLYAVDYDNADADDHEPISREVMVSAGETTGVISIEITDDTDIEPLRERFHLDLVPSPSYRLEGRSRVTIVIQEGICDRTPALRDSIVNAHAQRTHCAQFPRLNDYDVLQLEDTGLTSLKEKDFFLFSNLHTLHLHRNQLTTLPPGLFNDLSNLRILRLQRNNLTTLPSGLFSGLSNLEVLLLQHQYPDESSRGLTALPEGIFSGLDSLQMLRLDANQLTALPPGVFSGLSSLSVLHLHNNPGAPFSLVMRLESADETELSSALQTLGPVPVRLTLPEGAPYSLEVDFEVSGVTTLTNPVMFSAGATRSETFTVTRNRGAARIEINFAQLPPSPNDCKSGDRHNGQCFTGFQIAAEPYVYMQEGPGPQVSTIRFTSVPRSLHTYSAALEETIDVNVIFDGELIVPSFPAESSSPKLALNIGGSMRTAAYVPSRSGGNVLSFSYTLMEDDLDEDGVSIASGGLRLDGETIIGIFGRNADATLEDRFLNARPEHRVAARTLSLTFTALDGNVSFREGETAEAIFEITPAPAEPTTVYYAIDYDNADADDHGHIPLDNREVVVSAGTTVGTIQIFIEDDTDAEPPRERFHLDLVPSPGYRLEGRSRVTVNIREGVCDRTPQVRTAILAKLADVDDCAAVTNENLSGVSGTLDLDSQGITSLKERDFGGLVNLQKLYMDGNQLSTLPASVFDGLNKVWELRVHSNRLGAGDAMGTLPENLFAGLPALSVLRLSNNDLSTLPATIFSGLDRLNILEMSDNQLAELPDGVFADNDQITNLIMQNNRLRSLPDKVFFGLSDMQNLAFDDNQVARIPAGAFSGYTDLRSLRFRNNPVGLGSLPRGIFSEFTKLEWLNLRNTGLTKLPAGVFSGISRLKVLHLGDNPPGDFEFRLRLELADGAQAPSLTDPTSLRATLREGAPYTFTFEIGASNANLSSDEMTLSAGSTQSESVTLTPNSGVESVIANFVSLQIPRDTVETGCFTSQKERGRCFSGFEIVFDPEDPFILDAVVPMLTGVEIVSVPIGEAYASGETISVALNFNEEIVVIPGHGGLGLNLEIGSTRRIAVHDAGRSGTDTLVFGYEVADDDLDSDGISVPEDALVLNGARIQDRSGFIVDPSLAGHEISNERGHRVFRTLSLVFDPPVLEVVWGSSAAFSVTTRPPILHGNETVRIILDLGEALGAGLDFAGKSGTRYEVRLDSNTLAQRNNIVTAQPAATIGSSSAVSYALDVDGLPFIQVTGDIQIKRPLPLLTVKVTTPERTVVLSPDNELSLEPGGQGEVTLRLAGGATPPAVLSVSADNGFSVEPETVHFSASTPTVTVTVTAPATNAGGALRVEAVSGVTLREATELTLLSGSVREFTLSFEPVSLDLLAGVSTRVKVVLGNAEALVEGEEVSVALTPGVNLELSMPSVLLSRATPSMTVALRALLDAATGASDVTAQVSAEQARTLIARFREATLPVGIMERRIRVLFEPAEVELTPGASREETPSTVVVIRAEPELVESESVILNFATLDEEDNPVLPGPGARVVPPFVTLRPESDSHEVTVFSDRRFVRVEPQLDSRSTVEARKLRLGHLIVTLPSTGLRLRVRVFLEGALE